MTPAMGLVPWTDENDESGPVIRVLLEKKGGAMENGLDWKRVLLDEPPTEERYEEPLRFDPKDYTQASGYRISNIT
jgi:hypothetical protein